MLHPKAQLEGVGTDLAEWQFLFLVPLLLTANICETVALDQPCNTIIIHAALGNEQDKRPGTTGQKTHCSPKLPIPGEEGQTQGLQHARQALSHGTINPFLG